MIWVGTCGWSYPEGEGRWTGIVYPADTRVDQLQYYARYFQTVEVNSTFYRPMAPPIARAWAKKTPPNFKFAVKLFQKFTHPRMFAEQSGVETLVTKDDYQRFLEGVAPLAEAGKLGAVLAQFPPSFKCSEASLQYLEELLDGLAPFPTVVELRHRSWSENSSVAERLRAARAGWCMIDEPKFSSSLGSVPLIGGQGYFRFHGRNAAQWWTGDRETRYNYLYSAQEQEELRQRVIRVAEAAADTYVFYNNHYRGKAVVNALQLRISLGQPIEHDLPPTLVAEYPELRGLVS